MITSMKNSVIVFMVLSIVLFAGCIKEEVQEQSTTTTTQEGAQGMQDFTIDEVVQHNSQEDCWIVIDGKVYDVTSFVSSHPGGKAIVEGCGMSAKHLFETRPMGSGTPHSDGARNLLNDYFIGYLLVE